MAQVYGNRYENLGSIDGGGQGDIFRVRDIQDSAKAEYALKRLRKNERCDRFRLEIEALRRIDHPNVIKIIDHSGDPEPGKVGHKFWFVMPVAAGGNLEKRVALYKGDLDAVLKVALQLSDAVQSAHALGIVHRDVKPANVLFPRMDHDVWLSDFGICHFAADKAHLTPPGEVVGPRGFIAPELESGGNAQVTPAADVYSLGKVIYFMLSGGSLIAREQLNSPEYLAVFSKGERFGLLQTLLSRMIVPLDLRIKTAAQVQTELRYIEEWDRTAHSMALNTGALAAIEAAKRDASQQQQIKTNNAAATKEQERIILGAAQNFVTWLRAELEKLSALLTQGGTYETKIEAAMWKPDHNFVVGSGPGSTRDMFIGIGGLQFLFMNTVDSSRTWFCLKFFFAKEAQFHVQIGTRETPLRVNSDPQLAVIPYLVEQREGNRQWNMGGFINSKEWRRRSMRPGGGTPVLLTQSYAGPSMTLMAKFRASEWPSAALETVKAVFSEAVETAIQYSSGGTRAVGT